LKIISISKQHILVIQAHHQVLSVPIKVSLYKARGLVMMWRSKHQSLSGCT